MKEHPILFSAPMVRAILAGSKSQTRRVAKGVAGESPHPYWPAMKHGGDFVRPEHCPYGVYGDRLWVRETWQTHERDSDSADGIRYRADDAFVQIANTRAAADLWIEAHDNGKHRDDWRPSIFMKRWASRITLEITDVRVERLQAITEEDAKAEGVTERRSMDTWLCIPEAPGHGQYETFVEPSAARREKEGLAFVKHQPGIQLATAREEFSILWNSINGKRPGCAWVDNPCVWAVSFRRIAGAARV